jgi:hypothetical protein
LRKGGVMVFVAASMNNKLYGFGKMVSKNRFRIENVLTVFFYDSESIQREFGTFGLIDFSEINEPVKHIPDEEPMKFYQIVCQKR